MTSVLLAIVLNLLWMLVGMVVLSPHRSRIVKMMPVACTFVGSWFELEFWPYILYKVNKFEAEE